MIKVLDLFPLNSVVFPHQKMPLRIFESRYLKLAATCHKEGHSFGICLIREGNEVGAPAIPFKIGTSVTITEFKKVSDKFFYIVVQGERRFRIERFIQEQPHIKVEIEWLDEEIPTFPGDYVLLRYQVSEMVTDNITVPEDDNELFGLAGTLIADSLLEKQKILELSNDKVIPCLIRVMETL